MRRAVEARLVAAGVNLVINGHVHAYERSHPVIDFARDDCGPTYIVIGDGKGARHKHLVQGLWKEPLLNAHAAQAVIMRGRHSPGRTSSHIGVHSEKQVLVQQLWNSKVAIAPCGGGTGRLACVASTVCLMSGATATTPPTG